MPRKKNVSLMKKSTVIIYITWMEKCIERGTLGTRKKSNYICVLS